MYNFYAFMDRMKYIKRWQLMRSVREENIMEHSQQVAMLAHALAVIDNKIFGGSADAEKAALYAVFSRRTGYAPVYYFNQLKIQQASTYLDFTDLKITQICPRLGIDDPYYFSRLFRKHMGMSPSDYKKYKKG